MPSSEQVIDADINELVSITELPEDVVRDVYMKDRNKDRALETLLQLQQ